MIGSESGRMKSHFAFHSNKTSCEICTSLLLIDCYQQAFQDLCLRFSMNLKCFSINEFCRTQYVQYNMSGQHMTH